MNPHILIIGSGIAGLTTALSIDTNISVTIIDNGDGVNVTSSTQIAQGGIAGSKNWRLHFEDTMKAGGYTNDPEIVSFFCQNAYAGIEWLQKDIGVVFRKEPTLEGAHSERRVYTTGDDTGYHIYKHLFAKAQEKTNIRFIHNARTLSLLKHQNKVQGAVFYLHNTQEYFAISATATILCTGGIGGLFQYSTNPEYSRGDGLLLACDAGAMLEDITTIQFHPTGLKSNETPVFLLTESLRGEGAFLVNKQGERFMNAYPEKELSSRKVVVEAMMKEEEVFLDLRGKSLSFWEEHFPNIVKHLKNLHIDIQKDLIPVVPTEHFLCGGIKVHEYSKTSVQGLFALGECASTGLHGNNRLASNSLSEAVVFGRRLGDFISSTLSRSSVRKNPEIFAVQKAELQTKRSLHLPFSVSSITELATPYTPFASEKQMADIRTLVQSTLTPLNKNKIELARGLEKLPTTFEKRTVELFTL